MTFAQRIFDALFGAKFTAADQQALTVAGSPLIVDARGAAKLTIICPAGRTCTVERCSSTGAGIEATGNFTAPAGSASSYPVDWPFYRLTAVGGDIRYALS